MYETKIGNKMDIGQERLNGYLLLKRIELKEPFNPVILLEIYGNLWVYMSLLRRQNHA